MTALMLTPVMSRAITLGELDLMSSMFADRIRTIADRIRTSYRNYDAITMFASHRAIISAYRL